MKKSTFKRRMIAMITVFAIMIAGFSVSGQSNEDSVFKKVDSSENFATIYNNTLKLSVDADDGDITVTDLRNNREYVSTSQEGVENNWVTGPSRLAFLSQVSIDVIDDLGSLSTVHSYNGAVKNDGFTLYRSKDALCAEYKFEDEGICLSVEYRLDNDRIIVDIPTNKISVKGEYELADINILPYFGAATPQDDGQLLVPSGSGALIDFNNEKGQYGEFSQKVYGNDAMDLMDYRTEQGELILFPMYSMMYKNSDSAFVAYVENGAALATLKASASSLSSALTTASFQFNYHPYTLVNPLNTDSQSVKYNQLTRERADIDSFTLSYQFFNKNQSYFDIAQHVRNRMIRSGVAESKDALANKLYIDVLMGVNKTVYTLGIPHKTCYPLTTLSQASEIAKSFSELPVVMILKGIDSDGAYGGKIDTSFSVNKKIGSKKEYIDLEKSLKQNGGALYSVVNTTEYTKSAFGFSKLFNAARSVTGKNIMLYRYRFGDGQKNIEIEPLNLLNINKIEKGVNKFIKSAIKNKVSAVAPLSFSNSPYTCNTKSGDRNQMLTTFKSSLKAYKNAQMKLLLESPVDALVEYADDIHALPINSGRHKIFDNEIPFVQLVLNGLRNYSTPALNCDDSNVVILKALESGSSLAVSLYASEFDDIYDTPLKKYVSSEYLLQKERLKECIKEYSSVIEEFKNCKIVAHTVLSENVNAAEYSNGKKVIVNFGNTDYEYNSQRVAARSYIVTEGSEGDSDA